MSQRSRPGPRGAACASVENSDQGGAIGEQRVPVDASADRRQRIAERPRRRPPAGIDLDAFHQPRRILHSWRSIRALMSAAIRPAPPAGLAAARLRHGACAVGRIQGSAFLVRCAQRVARRPAHVGGRPVLVQPWRRCWFSIRSRSPRYRRRHHGRPIAGAARPAPCAARTDAAPLAAPCAGTGRAAGARQRACQASSCCSARALIAGRAAASSTSIRGSSATRPASKPASRSRSPFFSIDIAETARTTGSPPGARCSRAGCGEHRSIARSRNRRSNGPAALVFRCVRIGVAMSSISRPPGGALPGAIGLDRHAAAGLAAMSWSSHASAAPSAGLEAPLVAFEGTMPSAVAAWRSRC